MVIYHQRKIYYYLFAPFHYKILGFYILPPLKEFRPRNSEIIRISQYELLDEHIEIFIPKDLKW